MKWILKKNKNRLHRHDLRGLDSHLRSHRRSQRQMKIMGGVLGGVLAGAVLGWGSWLGVKSGLKQMFSENAFYQIKDIVVQSSGNALKPDQVIKDLRIQRGQNLLALDLEELRREMELYPVVEKAEVLRELPGRLVIRITERIPLANITVGTNGPCYQIDRAGIIMDLMPYQKNSEEFGKHLATLPRIKGAHITDLKIGRVTPSPEIFQALALIQKMDAMDLGFNLEIESINVSRRGTVMVNTTDGALVKMGVSDVDKQLRRWALILNDARQRSLKVATMDLTVERDVPVTFAFSP